LTNKKGDGCGSKLTVIGDPAVIVIVAEANFVGSAVEAAWTVTVPPVGTAEGAVYVVATPLAVWVGLNDPQAPALPQVTVQSTPAFVWSFETTAVIGLAELVCIDVGGGGLKTTVIAGRVMVMLAETNFVLSAVEVAWTVTVPPVGTVAGAVYVVATPLAVCVGLNDPQAPALPHVTVQSTPAFVESFETTAVMGLVALTWMDVGGVGLKTIVMGGGVVSVIVAETDFVLSAVEVAWTVTVPPVGTAEGAVYVVAAPLALCVGLNDPQAPALPHVTDQSTPAFDESFATTAVIGLVVLICIDVGGAGLNATEIGGGVALIMIGAEADLVLSAVEVATTVTVPPLGTDAGAV
jgi:hypothetical protein